MTSISNPKPLPKEIIHKRHGELRTLEEKRIWWEAQSSFQLELLARTLRKDLIEAYDKIENFKRVWKEFAE